jgi:hypothetical protein
MGYVSNRLRELARNASRFLGLLTDGQSFDDAAESIEQREQEAERGEHSCEATVPNDEAPSSGLAGLRVAIAAARASSAIDAAGRRIYKEAVALDVVTEDMEALVAPFDDLERARGAAQRVAEIAQAAERTAFIAEAHIEADGGLELAALRLALEQSRGCFEAILEARGAQTAKPLHELENEKLALERREEPGEGGAPAGLDPAEVCAVELGGAPTDLPRIFRRTKNRISRLQWRVLDAMHQEWPTRLKGSSIAKVAECEAEDVPKALRELRQLDDDWAAAISMAGSPHGGYGLAALAEGPPQRARAATLVTAAESTRRSRRAPARAADVDGGRKHPQK